MNYMKFAWTVSDQKKGAIGEIWRTIEEKKQYFKEKSEEPRSKEDEIRKINRSKAEEAVEEIWRPIE